MSQNLDSKVAVIGIDIGKKCCGKNGRVAKWKRGSPIYRLA